MRRCLVCLLLVGACVLVASGSSDAQFFGGDVVFDPTNFAKNAVTAAQMIQQVQHMIRQVANSDAEVHMLLQNLLASLNQAAYDLPVYERLLRQMSEASGPRPGARNLDYFHDDVQPTLKMLYPGVNPTNAYPARYAVSAEIQLNTIESLMGQIHVNAGTDADERYDTIHQALYRRNEQVEGNLQALQTGNAMTLTVADGVRRLEKANAAIANLIAVRNAHDVQKDAWGEAVFHESLVLAGAEGAVPSYDPRARGSVTYFDAVGGAQ